MFLTAYKTTENKMNYLREKKIKSFFKTLILKSILYLNALFKLQLVKESARGKRDETNSNIPALAALLFLIS